jgi:uncharacterized membrane protein HdeD (DUF308 family)
MDQSRPRELVIVRIGAAVAGVVDLAVGGPMFLSAAKSWDLLSAFCGMLLVVQGPILVAWARYERLRTRWEVKVAGKRTKGG